MPLNPSSAAVSICSAVAAVWPADTRTPFATNWVIRLGAAHSGAKVTILVASKAPRREIFSSCKLEICRFSCMPLHSELIFGPSRWMPSTPGTPSANATATASMASAIWARLSVIKVGSNPVVPNRRCALAMRAIVSTLGASLNINPPPPLTCASMNPGAR